MEHTQLDRQTDTDVSTLTSLAFLSEFLLILLSCIKLNPQEKMPVCVLYSMDFWLFMISPEEKLAGILGREGGREKERKRGRKGGKKGGREGGREGGRGEGRREGRGKEGGKRKGGRGEGRKEGGEREGGRGEQ